MIYLRKRDQEIYGPEQDETWIAAVRTLLTAWYEEAQRDLPWRINGDPYRILVSEMMLVQTTVTAVIPYFERFLGRFPNVGALAAADESDVLKSWEGLGYYRRARQLHAAARMIVDEYGGMIPADLAAVRALPGVGRYIAGAILSFAFDRPEPIVEANSQRVLARLLAIKENLRTASTQEHIWQAAGRLVPAVGRSGVHSTSADGAWGPSFATPREPGCLVCPLQVGTFLRLSPAGASGRLAGDDSETSAAVRHRSVCRRYQRRKDPDRSCRGRGGFGSNFLGIPGLSTSRGVGIRRGGLSVGPSTWPRAFED